MIGARDMAFPRLNAFGFWMSFSAGCCSISAILAAPGLTGAGSAPDVGWFAYAPLTARAFSRGHSTDYWILACSWSAARQHRLGDQRHRDGFGLRCKGMTLMRMPLFVWLICWSPRS